jgi:hypothetical protein
MPLSRRHAPSYFIILSVFQKIPYCILVLMLGEGKLALGSIGLGIERLGWSVVAKKPMLHELRSSLETQEGENHDRRAVEYTRAAFRALFTGQ